jgi:hypothetical protein
VTEKWNRKELTAMACALVVFVWDAVRWAMTGDPWVAFAAGMLLVLALWCFMDARPGAKTR